MTNVISMKDWVPGWVKDSYLTEDEINAFEEEARQSQLKQEDAESVLDNQTVLVGKAVAKLESIDRDCLEKWLHRIPAELLVELVDKPQS
ncbi:MULTISPECIES: hypothetical protein [unclassified Microcoleus]|uniref:hypothetical protein n=1 Tax=unclassified Microcoleus TaxID=2642155 RepID=UPI002FD0FD3E